MLPAVMPSSLPWMCPSRAGPGAISPTRPSLNWKTSPSSNNQSSALDPAGTLSLHPFSGNKNSYYTNNVPVVIGEPCGASPHAPAGTPGQCPGPNSGCNKLYLSYSFPVVRGEPCGASPHAPAGTLSLHPFSGNSNLFHTNSFPVKQYNMHAYFCRERKCFCELGARTAGHAETPLQR